MNRAIRTPILSPPPAYSLPSRTAAALFHSTPAVERRRGNQWSYASSPFRSSKRFNNTKRFRRMEAKQTLLRNVSKYAEYLFQSWKYDDDRSTSNNPSWYNKQYGSKDVKRVRYGPQESQWDNYRNRRKGRFEFCFYDEEIETMFQSAFRGKRGSYWSFCSDENFHWEYSSGYENRRGSSNWRFNSDDAEDDPSSVDDLATERLTLGLRASGPLELEEVKQAYRACALKWHPDRHQGSSKVEAEEKFKNCSVAYESLCERLAID